MSKNLLKRIITSIILLSLLIFINFSNKYIFISSIYLLSLIICVEAYNMFLKLAGFKNVKNYDASWREWGQDESCPIIDMTK